MEPMLVLMGLFILVAVVRNKELSENKEALGFMTMVILLLILPGIGFLFPASTSLFPNYSFVLFFLAMSAAITISAESGPIRVITRVAWVSVLVYIIFGSFW